MSTEDTYESERTATPAEAAAVLSSVADGLLTGSVRLGEGEDALAVEVPDELELEVEFEREGDELSLELELEWPAPEGAEPVTSLDEAEGSPEDGGSGTEDESGTGEESAADDASAANVDDASSEEVLVPVGATDATESLARFEVYRDRGDQWRWRLRHRNGNIIATSGEGYTRKHNAWKGLESVMANAPEAAVQEASEE